MFRYRDLLVLIEAAGIYPMPCGWRVMIRAAFVDVSANRPHGLDYALILQDAQGERLLGFDNAHGLDGADADAPFDHEHRASAVGQTLPYKFVSAAQLLTDFFDRCEAYCIREGVEYAFLEKDES